jgi:hypothetical protein
MGPALWSYNVAYRLLFIMQNSKLQGLKIWCSSSQLAINGTQSNIT